MKAKNRRLTDEQSRLVADNMGLAYEVARRRSRRYPWLDQEFVDAAIDGLIAAAFLFDASLGFKFSTLAWVAINDGISAAFRKYRRRLGIARFEALPDDAEGHEALRSDARLADESPDFEAILSVLGARDREILRKRYRDGLTLGQIGAPLGLSRERVNQLRRRAVAMLRDCGLARAGRSIA